MTTRRTARLIVIAAIAAIAFAWIPVAGDARRSAPPAVHRGNGLRARPSVRVRIAQRELRRLGYHLRVDGRFGRLTVLAVLRYQARHGLRSDGVVGRATRRALQRSVARVERIARRARARRRGAHRRHHAPATTAPRAHRTPATAPRAPASARPPRAPVSPAGVVPAASAARPSGVPTVPTAAPAEAQAATVHARRGWAGPFTIVARAVVLFIAAAPMLRESAPGGRRGARSAGP